jgi:hypothetical protein
MTPQEREDDLAITKRARQRIEDQKKAKERSHPAEGAGVGIPPHAVEAPSKSGIETVGAHLARESQIEKEEIPIAQTPSSYEEGTVYRDRILQYLREIFPDACTTGQIATRLKIGVPLALWALETLQEERLIANLGSDQWQYIQPETEKTSSVR